MLYVVEACHHGRISPKEVRRRLRGANRVGGKVCILVSVRWEAAGTVCRRSQRPMWVVIKPSMRFHVGI